MSILAAGSAGNLRGEALFAAACFVIALATGAGLLAWARGRKWPPERLPPGAPLWPHVVVVLAGVFFWFAVPTAYFAYRQSQLTAREGPEARLDPEKFSPRDLALLATVPPAVGFLALLQANAAVRFGLALDDGGGFRLGFGVRRLGPGLLLGVLSSACVLPLLFAFMQAVDWVYRWVNYEHPREHDLLRAMGEATDPMVSALLVLGAALAAPLFEELLFRGHLQTLFRRGFASLAGWKFQPPVDLVQPGEPAGPPAAAATLEQGVPGITVAAPPSLAAHSSLAVPVAHLVPVTPPAWATWAAIVATSVVFAAVHPQWTRPPIFLLSLCLGYAYERTGNLWVPVVIHAAFNSVSTLLYLAGAAN